jgi:hypothetical protein
MFSSLSISAIGPTFWVQQNRLVEHPSGAVHRWLALFLVLPRAGHIWALILGRSGTTLCVNWRVLLSVRVEPELMMRTDPDRFKELADQYNTHAEYCRQATDHAVGSILSKRVASACGTMEPTGRRSRWKIAAALSFRDKITG